MGCKNTSPLAKAVRAHRDFHFKTGLLLDKGARLLGLNRCPLTSPLYKLTKVAGYTHVALASIALVLLED
ncbi:MAG: hypothetical protein CV045_01480 [Cyanobacteria bacterium M5B4]|nr:hypothetical protein [Cyanobacteria bacterium KgW148]PLS69533.1 MAG: hypothetical protein CV045_01480 [Cyanobacteria bacterium M5B4]